MICMVSLPSGEIPDEQWDRIQQAVLARGDVDQFPNITLFPDIGEAEDVEAEMKTIAGWLDEEGLLPATWWG